MGRIVTFVLGFGVIIAAVWYVMYRPAHTDPEAAAARGLEPARKAADRIEGEMQQRADDLLKQRAEQE
ncbi:hypothetical protein JY651_49920 [Pyxidicoccus parkwayensis]|uniref:Uncharacterized protein n=1 Tax=Pyxidicoccus parkwayensis TaxID=2813578 RepID=A0ABX7NWF0_9BACT|nr:hypothetical protein [Pyxidicoccus parkwaysis]QSQ23120.1 hypothetical protein JY651_49920 [Pyxidicoccus parkwaysis]